MSSLSPATTMPMPAVAHRRLVLVLGDQLSHTSPALDGFDAARDAVLMIEAPGEATHVWSHKARIAIFLSAMRHFRDELRRRGFTVHHVALDDDGEPPALADRLSRALGRWPAQVLMLVEAGEWRVANDIARIAAGQGTELRVLDDTHFLCSRADFARWAGTGRSELRMELFYRHMRRTHEVLLDAGGKPEGGRWNFDAENRRGWPKAPPHRAGPGAIAPPAAIEPDAVSRDVLALVEERFADHPGSLESFAWPVDRAQALHALQVFIETRLPHFGPHQDAMWTDTPFGWHSLLSSSLNLHLLDPREVIGAAEQAYRDGHVPLGSAEGFIRQILGWREFIRGVYGLDMPSLATSNRLQATRALPAWYWTGETRMACARDAIGQTLRHGYAHHIQRLMVTGLFALLAEVEPRQVADWYLAVYVDAVEWVELPNVIGMALYADGARFTSKPYVASGAYIDRMSNHCAGCAYAPTAATASQRGKPLCPFTVLYWHFLDKHQAMLDANPRTPYVTQNWRKKSAAEQNLLREEAARMLGSIDSL